MHRFTVSFCFTKLKITNISEHSRVEWTVWKELNVPKNGIFVLGWWFSLFWPSLTIFFQMFVLFHRQASCVLLINASADGRRWLVAGSLGDLYLLHGFEKINSKSPWMNINGWKMIDFVLGPGPFPGCTLVLGFVEHHEKLNMSESDSLVSLAVILGEAKGPPDRMISWSDPVVLSLRLRLEERLQNLQGGSGRCQACCVIQGYWKTNPLIRLIQVNTHLSNFTGYVFLVATMFGGLEVYFLTSRTTPVTVGCMVSTWEAYGSNFWVLLWYPGAQP